jgi:hypothetical protein
MLHYSQFIASTYYEKIVKFVLSFRIGVQSITHKNKSKRNATKNFTTADEPDCDWCTIKVM